ncbi:hypothetical protein RintRC_6840 [Richelia intracellularis]|nr:hypothetical protein RintRC_6840 [Richelia intracellularis]
MVSNANSSRTHATPENFYMKKLLNQFRDQVLVALSGLKMAQ